MQLTIDQFNLLCRAVEQGHGIESWEKLERTCRLVLVKPHESCGRERFVASFARYRAKCDAAIQAILAADKSADKPATEKPPFKLGEAPTAPQCATLGRINAGSSQRM
ncbi:MAG: hypothetical protein HC805_08015, partial [Alkalinema sp. RL_2_19]|nr:hypothetical protein [Alkalinema sp. RL_2_19]